jgi:2-amino-4-hydroxy-6-hydroxymethyldihydropteridine diphosphokinase
MTARSAFVALGANLPFEGREGPALLQHVLHSMTNDGWIIRARSSLWRSEAWPPGSAQPDYTNAVVELDAGRRSPQEVLAALQAVEMCFGRERRSRWAPRTLDLDIIAMEGLTGVFGDVILPHPAMHERAFVLAPLAEIAPHWRHPELGMTASELLARAPPVGRFTRLRPFL